MADKVTSGAENIGGKMYKENTSKLEHSYGEHNGKVNFEVAYHAVTRQPASLEMARTDEQGNRQFSISVSPEGGIKMIDYKSGKPVESRINDPKKAEAIYKAWNEGARSGEFSEAVFAKLEKAVSATLKPLEENVVIDTQVGGNRVAAKLVNGQSHVVLEGKDFSPHADAARQAGNQDPKMIAISANGNSYRAHEDGKIDVDRKGVKSVIEDPKLVAAIKDAWDKAKADGIVTDKEFQKMAEVAGKGVDRALANGGQGKGKGEGRS